MKLEKINKIDSCIYEISKDYKSGMRVPARIYATERLLENMDDAVVDQVTNVAMLPGIVKYAICLPDGHSGYGFPIGGVAAIDPVDGVISPGGIGFDINCGIRLVATSLTLEEIRPKIKRLVDRLFSQIPSGVGAKGVLNLSNSKFDQAMIKGANWAVENGYGQREDIEYIEDRGCIRGANPASVSNKARERGRSQIGTLGSGNHFLEIQIAKRENLFDEEVAREFGIFLDDQVLIMIHCGSRAFGHQIASDYLLRFVPVAERLYGLTMPDRELACAPFNSQDGRAYFEAMNCAINIAYLNRELILHRIREVFADVFQKSPDDLGIRLVYDVCHNTAKLEKHIVDGKERDLLVHRKGATRAFASKRKELPKRYLNHGQPVIIGGSMESGSYLLVGIPDAEKTFFTTAHGSGRIMSRRQAKKRFFGKDLQRMLEVKDIYVQTASLSGLAEEAGAAYKNIDEVVEATRLAGLSRPVAKLIPIGNIKG
ncbi:MAG: RtcB family protein [Spirochaetota bacterium]|nr:RtcB family protein [Spirochaetota bacterium]